MAEQQFLRVTQPSNPSRATPESFGSDIARELQAAGAELRQTTVELNERIAKPRARQAAADYQKRLALEIQNITDRPELVDKWDEMFENALKAHDASDAKTHPMLSSMKPYRDNVRLAQLDAQLQLQTAKNAVLVKEAAAIQDQNEMNFVNDFLAAVTPEEQDRLLNAGAAGVVLEGVDTGLYTPGQIDVEETRVRTRAVQSAAMRLIGAGAPNRAIRLMDKYAGMTDGEKLSDTYARAASAANTAAKSGLTEAGRMRRFNTQKEEASRMSYRLLSQAIRVQESAKDPGRVAQLLAPLNDMLVDTGWTPDKPITETALREAIQFAMFDTEDGSGLLLTEAQIDGLIEQIRGERGEPTGIPVEAQKRLAKMRNAASRKRSEYEAALDEYYNAGRISDAQYAAQLKLWDDVRVKPYRARLEAQLELMQRRINPSAVEAVGRIIGEFDEWVTGTNPTGKEIDTWISNALRYSDVYNQADFSTIAPPNPVMETLEQKGRKAADQLLFEIMPQLDEHMAGQMGRHMDIWMESHPDKAKP